MVVGMCLRVIIAWFSVLHGEGSGLFIVLIDALLKDI